MKRMIFMTILVSVLSGCTAFMYGWESDVYERQLVSIDSEKGKHRIAQIIWFDPTVEDLISTGYKPTHLYEVNTDEFYLISADGKGRHYRFVRPEGVASNLIEIDAIPDEALKKMPLHYPIVSQQLQSASITEGVATSHSDTPVVSTEVGAAEPKLMAKPTPPPKPLEKAYYIKGVHPTIFISDHKRKPSIKPSEYKNYEYVVVGQVLEDKTARIPDDFIIESNKVVTGYRKAPNAKHVRAQVNVQRAQRKYQEALNQKAITGGNNAVAFFSGMINQKLVIDAEEGLYEAKMRLMREPEYINEPVYENQYKKVYRTNIERTVKIKVTKYQGLTKVGETELTKKLSNRTKLDDQAAINSTVSSLKRKTVNLDLDGVSFN